MTLNQVIQMYIDAGNVKHIQNLINAAILLYRKHGLADLNRYCTVVIMPEYGLYAAEDLARMIIALDPAIISLNYGKVEE